MHNDFLMHHGIKGMHWGERNGPPYPLNADYNSPEEMSYDMKTWKYRDFHTLQTPAKTKKDRAGSCHDQAFYEAEQLRRMGYSPQLTFFMEHDGKGQVGTTHTYVHYNKGKKHIWFENAWQGREGLHEFTDADAIRKEIILAHKMGETGNPKRYPYVEFADFDSSYHFYGEDLQDYVLNCLKDDDEK